MAKVVTPDFERLSRCGIPEIVYGDGKTAEDMVEIAQRFLAASGRMIATKMSEEKVEAVKAVVDGEEYIVDYNQRGRTLVVKKAGFEIKQVGVVGIITAGTSDIPIAEESKVVAQELGCTVHTAYDVGVAGIHRIYPVIEQMKDASAIIVVAGMEGALPSVVSGLVDVPVIGVPTSVGYGTGKGGKTALYTMLNSCTPVAVVNIDNGYGAAVLARQITRR